MYQGPAFAGIGRPTALRPRANNRSIFPSYDQSTLIYVSAVACWGIPIGNDTTGDGSRANPYLTLAKGYAQSVTGKVILLNGDPASPTDYRHATSFQFNVNKNVTIGAVARLGAKITSTTTSGAVLTASSVAGTTNTLNDLIIDGQGLCPYGVAGSSSPATPYTVILNGCKIIGYTLYGFAGGTGSNTHIQATLNNCWIEATGARFCVNHDKALGDSFIVINGGIFNNFSALYSFGCVRLWGVAAGAYLRINGGSFYRSAGTTGGSSTPTVHVQDALATIRGASISCSDPTGKSSGGDKGILLMTSTAGSALDMSGWEASGNTIYIDNSAGGMGICIGSDSTGVSPQTQADGKLNNGLCFTNQVSGSAASAAGGLHGIFNSCQSNSKFYRNRVFNVGLGLVEKGGNGAFWYSNLIIDCPSSCMLMKGSVNPTFLHNTAVQKTATGPLIAMNTNSGVSDTSGGQWIGNLLVNLTGSTIRACDVNASQVATFSYNNYANLGAGALTWYWLGAQQTTLALWKTASNETTATALDPLFVDATNSNYALQSASPVKGLVPYNANAPTDYTGAAFPDPCSVGAYQ